MLSQLRPALVCLAVLVAVTGVGYPLLVTGVAQAALHDQANGSVMAGTGSRWIGQSFDEPRYFWGRLSATTDANGKALPYNASSSMASNLGPSSPALLDEVKGRMDALAAADPDNHAPVPVDLVTSSGSGLDPDISPAAALYQVHRVARARGVSDDAVRAVVLGHVTPRQLGVLGEPRVNVLELNLAIDALR